MEVRADIVMPVWNHLDLTQRAVQSIRDNTTIPWRLIVVDNGSTDGTKEWLAKQDDITVISNEMNRGFAPAINQGLALATAPYTVLLNNDVEVDADWLRLLIQGLDANPHIGAINPLSTAKQMEWEGYFRDRHGVMALEHPGAVSLAFYCTVFRRKVIDEVGLLDENFAPIYGEDNDYAVRMRKAGWGQAIHCDVLVHHNHQATTGPAGQDKYHAIAVQKLREKWPEEGF